MASKFSTFFFVSIAIIVSCRNNLRAFNIATEASSFGARKLSEKNTANADIFTAELKHDRIDFNRLQIPTLVQNDKNETIFSFDQYYNTKQIYDYLDYLAQTYKNIVQIIPIGQTWENRTIKTIKISSGNTNNTAIWMDGGIHAREWISISSVLFITHALLTNWYDLDPVFRTVDYYLTPVLNPDGYEYSHRRDRFWRLNRRKIGLCYGVDLNRNFPYKWNEVAEMNIRGYERIRVCGIEYAGPSPLSELESQAVVNFFTKFPANKFKGFITYHTYGRNILYPYGYDFRIPKSFTKLHYIAQTAADKIFNVTGQQFDVSSGNFLYIFAGNSMDWAYKVAKIPYSYLVELRDDSSFDLPPSEIIPAGKEALIIAMTLVDNFDSSAPTLMSIPVNLMSNYENQSLIVESDD